MEYLGDVLFSVSLDAEKVRSYVGRVAARFDAWKNSETGVNAWMADMVGLHDI